MSCLQPEMEAAGLTQSPGLPPTFSHHLLCVASQRQQGWASAGVRAGSRGAGPAVEAWALGFSTCSVVFSAYVEPGSGPGSRQPTASAGVGDPHPRCQWKQPGCRARGNCGSVGSSETLLSLSRTLWASRETPPSSPSPASCLWNVSLLGLPAAPKNKFNQRRRKSKSKGSSQAGPNSESGR